LVCSRPAQISQFLRWLSVHKIKKEAVSMPNTESTQTERFLDGFYRASITSGALAASYKQKLTTRAARAIVTALDAGINYDKIIEAVREVFSERQTLTESQLARCQKKIERCNQKLCQTP
jgi:hypothetical protein